jgi:KaiC/GvpD/RAD55 family RecA-like ATPase
MRLISDFPSYYTVLLLGPPGVGKREYCLYLLKTWLERGERVIYITSERSPEEIRNEAKIDLEKNLLFIDLYSQEGGNKHRGYQLLLHLRDIEIEIEDAVEKLGAPVRIIFDSLSMVFIYTATSLMVSFIQNLTEKVRREYGFIMYTVQEGVHDPRFINTILSFVDGFLQMKFEEGETVEKKFRIHHLKGLQYDSSWMPFNLKMKSSM